MKSTLSELCKTCGHCCQCMVLPVRKPLNKAMMQEWIESRGCQIIQEDPETIYVKIDFPCPHLIKSNNEWICDVYENRSEGCRIFDGTSYGFLNCKWKNAPQLVILEKSK